MTTTINVPADVQALAQKVSDHDGASWYHQCHAASIAIVESGLYPGSRVARGAARGVFGQHSWVVLPREGQELANCYDPKARILDPTLWSYDEDVFAIWEGPNLQRHTPHGKGTFINGSKPYNHGGDDIEMPKEIANTLSYRARDFLMKVGALGWDHRVVMDARGWMDIAHLPVEGWPSAEIIAAMYRTPGIAVFIPIDIVGMVTDLNPEGLYLQGPERG